MLLHFLELPEWSIQYLHDVEEAASIRVAGGNLTWSAPHQKYRNAPEFVAHAFHLGYKTKEAQQNLWKSHSENQRREQCAIIQFYRGDIDLKNGAGGPKWHGKLNKKETRWDYHTGTIEGCNSALEAPPRSAVCISMIQQEIASLNRTNRPDLQHTFSTPKKIGSSSSSRTSTTTGSSSTATGSSNKRKQTGGSGSSTEKAKRVKGESTKDHTPVLDSSAEAENLRSTGSLVGEKSNGTSLKFAV